MSQRTSLIHIFVERLAYDADVDTLRAYAVEAMVEEYAGYTDEQLYQAMLETDPDLAEALMQSMDQPPISPEIIAPAMFPRAILANARSVEIRDADDRA